MPVSVLVLAPDSKSSSLAGDLSFDMDSWLSLLSSFGTLAAGFARTSVVFLFGGCVGAGMLKMLGTSVNQVLELQKPTSRRLERKFKFILMSFNFTQGNSFLK